MISLNYSALIKKIIPCFLTPHGIILNWATGAP
jgi:hypothetical protein